MAVQLLVNGVATGQLSALDRGFGYGDGLFESVRLVDGRAPLWSRHMQRLAEGCSRLRIPPPDPLQLWSEVQRVGADIAQAVVRITVTRGIGERGYAMPASPQPSRVVAAFVAPTPGADVCTHGLHMRVCELRLAEQPLLAGIKHLNRLEQVLARAEWSDPAVAEGLLRDSHDRVISATMANLFAVIDGVLLTPALDRCGVAGVARAEVLAIRPAARVTELSLPALSTASEIFLSSSVRGILPVKSLDQWNYVPGAVTRQLQQHWRNLGFSMEQGG
ncbi:MAG TPA: aminodeoxychorismate lyase [Rhodanobacter sp.]|nr:aminodeoxychorismate lyase [Rhodanobacter sp.]